MTEQPGTGQSELEMLRRRVAELELQAQSGQGVLFSGMTPPKASEQSLLRLQQLAGGAPSRLGAHERLAREARPEQMLEAF